MPSVRLQAFVVAIESSPLEPWLGLEPWEITGRSEAIVRRLVEDLSRDEFVLRDGIAVHRTAIVEPAATRSSAAAPTEAGSVVCNHRNARTDAEVRV